MSHVRNLFEKVTRLKIVTDLQDNKILICKHLKNKRHRHKKDDKSNPTQCVTFIPNLMAYSCNCKVLHSFIADHSPCER